VADFGTKKDTLLYKEKLRRIDLLDWLKGTFTETLQTFNVWESPGPVDLPSPSFPCSVSDHPGWISQATAMHIDGPTQRGLGRKRLKAMDP